MTPLKITPPVARMATPPTRNRKLEGLLMDLHHRAVEYAQLKGERIAAAEVRATHEKNGWDIEVRAHDRNPINPGHPQLIFKKPEHTITVHFPSGQQLDCDVVRGPRTVTIRNGVVQQDTGDDLSQPIDNLLSALVQMIPLIIV